MGFLSYNKEAEFDYRKIFDPISEVWKAELLKDGEVIKEYEEADERKLDFMIANDMQELRAIEKMKFLT